MTETIVPYLGSIAWYRALLRGDMQPLTTPPNRALIRGAWGEQTLTVPIQGGRRKLLSAPYHTLVCSEHDDWRHKHWQALCSAYGSLPYFPYLAPEFEAVYMGGPFRPLAVVCEELHRAFMHSGSLPQISAWIAEHPEQRPATRPLADIPESVSAVEVLFRYGPETIFYLL